MNRSANISMGERKFKLQAIVVLIAAASFILCGCDRSSREKVIDGKQVKKGTTWHFLSTVVPIPYRVWTVYYVYIDDKGNQIRHGPFKSFDRHGKLEEEAFYRDGKLDGLDTTWSSSGRKSQIIWRKGNSIGNAEYENDRLAWYREDIFENDKRVAEKKYDSGKWNLSFYCGSQIDQDINQQTGELVSLAPPFSISCE